MRASLLPCAGGIAALFLSACSTYDDAWPQRDGLPDLAALEQVRADDPDQDDSVGAFAWIPLVNLQGEIYGPSKPHLAAGTSYTDFDAYGPLFFAGDVEKFHYGQGKELYEREQQTHAAWGLWQRKRNDVKVPSGWRVETEASLLWGLLSWPDVYYVTDAPATVRAASVKAASVQAATEQAASE